jgi:hypothetical protein
MRFYIFAGVLFLIATPSRLKIHMVLFSLSPPHLCLNSFSLLISRPPSAILSSRSSFYLPSSLGEKNKKVEKKACSSLFSLLPPFISSPERRLDFSRSLLLPRGNTRIIFFLSRSTAFRGEESLKKKEMRGDCAMRIAHSYCSGVSQTV